MSAIDILLTTGVFASSAAKGRIAADVILVSSSFDAVDTRIIYTQIHTHTYTHTYIRMIFTLYTYGNGRHDNWRKVHCSAFIAWKDNLIEL